MVLQVRISTSHSNTMWRMKNVCRKHGCRRNWNVRPHSQIDEKWHEWTWIMNESNLSSANQIQIIVKISTAALGIDETNQKKLLKQTCNALIDVVPFTLRTHVSELFVIMICSTDSDPLIVNAVARKSLDIARQLWFFNHNRGMKKTRGRERAARIGCDHFPIKWNLLLLL